MLTVLQLRNFLALMEQGNVHVVAEERGVDNSRVWALLRTFEEEMGVKLMHRCDGNVVPTPDAYRVVGFVKDILCSVEELYLEMHPEKDVEPEAITVAPVAPVVSPQVLGRRVHRMQ